MSLYPEMEEFLADNCMVSKHSPLIYLKVGTSSGIKIIKCIHYININVIYRGMGGAEPLKSGPWPGFLALSGDSDGKKI